MARSVWRSNPFNDLSFQVEQLIYSECKHNAQYVDQKFIFIFWWKFQTYFSYNFALRKIKSYSETCKHLIEPRDFWVSLWNKQLFDHSGSNKIPTHNHLVRKRTLNHFTKLVKWLICVVSTYLYGAFDFVSLHVTYVFYNESALCSCLNVKELFGFESRCSHLNFRYQGSFEQEVLWHSDNCRA